MNQSMIPTTLPNYEPATILKRLGAKFLDIMILIVINAILAAIISITGMGINSIFKNETLVATMSGIGLVLPPLLTLIAYEVVPTQRWGQTLGKKALNIRVVDKQGNLLSFWSSLLRSYSFYIIAIVSFLLIMATLTVLGWVLIWALGKYQRLPHEWLSGSYTVQEFKRQAAFTQAETGKVEQQIPTPQRPIIASPFADLERLKMDGMISDGEYQKKRQELHIK